MHQSIATIHSPEFINLQPLELNPLMSACEIKVLYLGKNRNQTSISKEVATKMAKTLRGAPIVGYYKEDKQDFHDHGNSLILTDQGFEFECKTFPYGFVSPDAKVWFQIFEDYDDFGNSVQREYLMTTGYLWTGQFPEAELAVKDGGRPHSMELDDDTCQGNWTTDINTNMDFFIINDAIFSKLCILGEDIEPCFEGSSISVPKVSKTFSLDNNFKQTLYTMMQDLKNFALEGGKAMDTNVDNTNVVVDGAVEPTDTSFAKKTDEETKPTEKTDNGSKAEGEESVATKEKCSDTVDKKEPEDNTKEKSEPKQTENDDEEKKKKYSLLQTEFTALQEKFNNLEKEYNSLLEFKLAIENEKKDELINSFYMLSDEDKQDVLAHKTEYTYDDIEAKLSVICVRKKVNFDLDNKTKIDNNTKEESPSVTYNVDNSNIDSIPAFVQALKNRKEKN